MIFAVQYCRPFYVFSREQCDTKITELLDLFGLSNHMLVTEAEKKNMSEINYEEVHSRIAEDRNCKFALWKESRYLSNMRKTLDKKMAVDLLKKGRTHVKDFYSAKKDKTFAADLVMRVEEGRAQYSLEFPKTPMKTKT